MVLVLQSCRKKIICCVSQPGGARTLPRRANKNHGDLFMRATPVSCRISPRKAAATGHYVGEFLGALVGVEERLAPGGAPDRASRNEGARSPMLCGGHPISFGAVERLPAAHNVATERLEC